jgi:hypothetical protein
VLTMPVAQLTAQIRRGRRPSLLFLVLLSNGRRDSVSLVLRLRVLGRTSGERTIDRVEVHNTLQCLVVGKSIFR